MNHSTQKKKKSKRHKKEDADPLDNQGKFTSRMLIILTFDYFRLFLCSL